MEEIKTEAQVTEQPQKEVNKEEIIKHPDDNGCSYFNWCKKININGLVNRTCYNPQCYLGPLEEKCKQLARKEDMPQIEKVEKTEQSTIREQIKETIMKDIKKSFTVTDIIMQEVKKGNKDVSLISEILRELFPEEKIEILRRRIRPGIKYCEDKLNAK